jgi:hypothetical protein
MSGCESELFGSGYGQEICCFEYGNKSYDFIKDESNLESLGRLTGQFLDRKEKKPYFC